MLKKISTKDAPAAIGPYSQAVVAGDFYMFQVKFQLIQKLEKSKGLRLKNKQNK